MLNEANSLLNDFVKPITAALLELYIDCPKLPSTPIIEVKLIIEPQQFDLYSKRYSNMNFIFIFLIFYFILIAISSQYDWLYRNEPITEWFLKINHKN